MASASSRSDVSYVAWSNSSTNILAFGDTLIETALRSSGALSD
jgi:hypothetical protein